MKDYSSYHSPVNDRVVYDTEILFKEKLNTLDGFDVLIDSIPQRVIIHNHTNPMDEYKEDRKLMCLNDVKINRGSYVALDGDSYLVVTDIDNNQVFKTCKIRKTNNKVNFYNLSNKPDVLPCIISNRTLYTDGLKVNKYLTLPDGKCAIVVQNNEKTNKFYTDQRFIFNNNKVFKISQIDDYSQDGLLNIIMTQDIEHANDDFNNNLAYNNNSPIEIYSLLDSIKLKPTETLQLKTSIKQDGKVVNLPLAYKSLNENIATVDEIGLITAISNGVTQIKISLKDNPEIYTNVELEVTALPISNNFTIELNGVSDIIKGRTEIYTARIYNNGIEALGEQFDFEVVTVDSTPSNSYQIISVTDTTINIKCLSYSTNATPYYIKLIAYKKDDHTIFADKQIKLKGLI